MSQAKKPPQKKAKYQGFVNVSLTNVRKSEISAAFDKGVDIGECIDNLTSDGYKISISHSAQPAFYTVTAMQMDTTSGHAGYCTSSRHGDLEKAVYTLQYSITQILNIEGWPLNNGDVDW